MSVRGGWPTVFLTLAMTVGGCALVSLIAPSREEFLSVFPLDFTPPSPPPDNCV